MDSYWHNIAIIAATIEGTWYNPATQTQFAFSCAQNDSNIIIATIIPHRAVASSLLRLELCLAGGRAAFKMGNKKFAIAIAGTLVYSMHISIAPGEILQLIKVYQKSTGN